VAVSAVLAGSREGSPYSGNESVGEGLAPARWVGEVAVSAVSAGSREGSSIIKSWFSDNNKNQDRSSTPNITDPFSCESPSCMKSGEMKDDPLLEPDPTAPDIKKKQD
jgi:hypothetical protein